VFRQHLDRFAVQRIVVPAVLELFPDTLADEDMMVWRDGEIALVEEDM
jgi:hypothetical protein